MYEMRVEEGSAGGTELLWHVLSKDSSATLCGLKDRRLVRGGVATDRLCPTCIATFDQVMTAGGPSCGAA